ncbi:F-box/FBD/LRR-repeat protein At1g13570-like [Rosa rugosa]|uniref:F-box/FBD/LRR-repeat protein At1g13570-like n=1 Tax=Rosa rugosa TaxID=74645 RepID=UPI002B4007B0|nr:F-box/FBD/LRR-repeat protein At1g13570-like [Rosa rugosa]
MKKSKRPESCSNVKMKSDRISNLPSDVIDKILSHLPLRDVARTCVLSSKWRYKLVMLPHLVFDPECSSSIVDHVLLSHIGPVTKFKLSQGCKGLRDIDRWILHLSRYSLKEFVVDLWMWERQPVQRYKMPSCMFSCQDIIHLKLRNFMLKPPSTFKGFRSLKSLDIEHVTLAQDVLEKMFLCCPLLTRFTLRDCDGFSRLKIDAPNLQFLVVCGSYEDFNVVNTLNLADVSMFFYNTRVPCSSSKLIKFFDDLPCIQRLQINRRFLKYVAAGALLEKLPKPCLQLKFLKMNICTDDREDVLTALCLLRSSPALEELEILTNDFSHNTANVGTANSCLDHNRSYSFTQLRHVKICNISGLEGELDFIQFLLLCSPVLETVTICWGVVHDTDESLELVKKLLRLRRASGNVEIIYLDK